jgi:hypothetical protein
MIALRRLLSEVHAADLMVATDVDSTTADVLSTGQGLKNTLEAYNSNKLFVTGVDQWWAGTPAERPPTSRWIPVADVADAFWKVAKDHGVVLT